MRLADLVGTSHLSDPWHLLAPPGTWLLESKDSSQFSSGESAWAIIFLVKFRGSSLV